MALKILKSSEPLTVERIVLTVYAVPGLGKTTLGFTADAPLLLDFDGGAYRAGNRGDTVQMKSWEDVAGITAEDLKGYKTLILDTAGRALDLLTVDIIRANPKMGRGGALTLQGYGELKSRFLAFANLVKSFGLDIVLISHSDEQKSGDDLIERLDIQGGSKNEIYKSSDLMGRLFMRGGKRYLNFSPSDVSFGKNPAGFPEMEVPNFATEQKFLASVIAKTKDALNRQTAEQAEVAQEITDWTERFGKGEKVEDFNRMIGEVQTASDGAKVAAKKLLVKYAKAKGFTLDAKTKQFVSPVAPTA